MTFVDLQHTQKRSFNNVGLADFDTPIVDQI